MDTTHRKEAPAIPRQRRCSLRTCAATWEFMFGSGREWLCALVLVTGLGVRAGAAPACVGDCDGDGMVGVAELITGVGISLGEQPLSRCVALDANGDGELRIDELVMAVNAALGGCPATPTPSATGTATATSTVVDTPSPTPTSTPSDTPTATPTVPMVAGQWREEPLEVTGSTCPSVLTQAFADDLAARPACEQSVESVSELAITLEDCTGARVDGTLDRDGTIRVVYPTTTDTVDSCSVALTASATIPAASSPTTAAYTFALAFSGSCPVEDCAIQAEGTWTRL